MADLTGLLSSVAYGSATGWDKGREQKYAAEKEQAKRLQELSLKQIAHENRMTEVDHAADRDMENRVYTDEKATERQNTQNERVDKLRKEDKTFEAGLRKEDKAAAHSTQEYLDDKGNLHRMSMDGYGKQIEGSDHIVKLAETTVAKMSDIEKKQFDRYVAEEETARELEINADKAEFGYTDDNGIEVAPDPKVAATYRSQLDNIKKRQADTYGKYPWYQDATGQTRQAKNFKSVADKYKLTVKRGNEIITQANDEIELASLAERMVNDNDKSINSELSFLQEVDPDAWRNVVTKGQALKKQLETGNKEDKGLVGDKKPKAEEVVVEPEQETQRTSDLPPIIEKMAGKIIEESDEERVAGSLMRRFKGLKKAQQRELLNKWKANGKPSAAVIKELEKKLKLKK